MFVPNIPRRKIYETMLVFEEGMIELDILLQNNENYTKFYDAFHDEGLPKIRKSYLEIKALLIMFLEHRKYNSEEDFYKDMKKLTLNKKEMNRKIFDNHNVPKKFKSIIKRIDFGLDKFMKIPNKFLGRIIYRNLDKFNSEIPKLLEIRRDKMK